MLLPSGSNVAEFLWMQEEPSSSICSELLLGTGSDKPDAPGARIIGNHTRHGVIGCGLIKELADISVPISSWKSQHFAIEIEISGTASKTLSARCICPFQVPLLSVVLYRRKSFRGALSFPLFRQGRTLWGRLVNIAPCCWVGQLSTPISTFMAFCVRWHFRTAGSKAPVATGRSSRRCRQPFPVTAHQTHFDTRSGTEMIPENPVECGMSVALPDQSASPSGWRYKAMTKSWSIGNSAPQAIWRKLCSKKKIAVGGKCQSKVDTMSPRADRIIFSISRHNPFPLQKYPVWRCDNIQARAWNNSKTSNDDASLSPLPVSLAAARG